MVVERVTRISNPRRKRRMKAKARRKNPVAMTLGMINPHPKGTNKTMAKKKYSSKKRNPARSHTKRRTHRHGLRRNPMVSHASGGVAMAKSVVGGLIGVALTKTVSSMLSNAVPALSSGIMRVVLSVGAAFGVGKLVSSIDSNFGAAAAFGGYMVAGSDALNVVAPQLAGTIGLKGLGVWMPSRFAVPENPVMRGAVPIVAAPAAGVGAFRGNF